MSVSKQAMLLGLLVGLIFCFRGIESAANDNRPAFLALCNLIGLTEKKITLSVDPPTGLEDDLIKLNMTTAEDDWFKLTEEIAKEGTTWDKFKTEKLKETKEDVRTYWEKMFPKWKAARKALDTEAGPNEFARPPAGNRRALAHIRIRRMWKIYEEIEENRKALKRDMEAKKMQIDIAFNLARANTEDGVVNNQHSGSGNTFQADTYTAACGGSGGTTAVGISLANDLTCLCAANTKAQANTLCGNTETELVTALDWTNAGQAHTAYGRIKPHCPTTETIRPTARTIQKLLRNFTILLGRGDGTTGAHEYILGGVATAGAAGCDGDSAPSHVCVNYKANLHGTGTGIPWVRHLDKAAELLEHLDEEEKQIQGFNAREEALRDAAWTAYDEAKVAEPKVPPTGEKTAKPADAAAAIGATTEAEAPAKGESSMQRFILPWTLFI